MVFLTNTEKFTEEKDMVLLGISTQAHVVDVGLHFFLFFLKHKSIVTAAMSSGGQPNIHCVTHIPEAWVSGLSGRGHCGCGAVQGQ